MKREKVTIYYNKTLFISAIIICVILITMPLSIMVWLTNGFRELGNRTGFFSTLFFLLAGLAMPIYFLYNGVNAHMVFTKDGIEYRQIFRKTEVHTYKEYPYVNKAFYPYYGLPMYYMVRVGPEMIKIRYNKKNYERLLSIVPSRIALSLQAQFKDIPPKRFNFCI